MDAEKDALKAAASGKGVAAVSVIPARGDALFGGRLISSKSLDAMKTLESLPEHIAQNVSGEPGYQAGAFHRADTGRTVCVLAGIEDGFSAQELALEILAAY